MTDKMKQIFIFVLISVTAFSQTELPDPSFENWENVYNSKDEFMYEDLTDDFWETLNKLRLLGGPVTVEKTENANSGNYAVRMETKEFGTFRITGLLMSGFFDSKADPGENMKEGKPFTGKPAKLIAYVMNFPENNDSAAIYINLTRWQNNKRDTIAEASMSIGREISEYEPVELLLDYYLPESTPDTIKVVFLSSAGGRNFTGNSGSKPQLGSVFYVDDASLEYLSGVSLPLIEDNNSMVYYDGLSDMIYIKTEEDLQGKKIAIFDQNGKIYVNEIVFPPYTINARNLPQGAYYYNILDGNKLIESGSLLIIR